MLVPYPEKETEATYFFLLEESRTFVFKDKIKLRICSNSCSEAIESQHPKRIGIVNKKLKILNNCYVIVVIT